MLGKQASTEEEIEQKGSEKNSQIQANDVLTGIEVSRAELALKLCSLSVMRFFEVY